MSVPFGVRIRRGVGGKRQSIGSRWIREIHQCDGRRQLELPQLSVVCAGINHGFPVTELLRVFQGRVPSELTKCHQWIRRSVHSLLPDAIVPPAVVVERTKALQHVRPSVLGAGDTVKRRVGGEKVPHRLGTFRLVGLWLFLSGHFERGLHVLSQFPEHARPTLLNVVQHHRHGFAMGFLGRDTE